jgi:hypothetical protein
MTFRERITGPKYHSKRTPPNGADVPFTKIRYQLNLLQRVGGRAGTAAPQGVVCELPNPLFFPASLSTCKSLYPRGLHSLRTNDYYGLAHASIPYEQITLSRTCQE